MAYKYYSTHRPIDIGTIPSNRKPESIVNYDGYKEVTAEDGSRFMAWGEVVYSRPLTEEEIYQYELRRDFQYPPFKRLGYWMGESNYPVIRIEDRLFVLNGWNGTDYGHCWECFGKYDASRDSIEYTLTPVLYADTNEGQALMETMYDMEEDSDEWNAAQDKLGEVVSYRVAENC